MGTVITAKNEIIARCRGIYLGLRLFWCLCFCDLLLRTSRLLWLNCSWFFCQFYLLGTLWLLSSSSLKQ
uniref:Ovule protein n=1 Tax=Parascaris univalens TaxID=6257 RepID=A0A915BW66_PARUN